MLGQLQDVGLLIEQGLGDGAEILFQPQIEIVDHDRIHAEGIEALLGIDLVQR